MAKAKKTPLSKREQRAEINTLMAAFLKKGGKIKRAPKPKRKMDRTFRKSSARPRRGAPK